MCAKAQIHGLAWLVGKFGLARIQGFGEIARAGFIHSANIYRASTVHERPCQGCMNPSGPCLLWACPPWKLHSKRSTWCQVMKHLWLQCGGCSVCVVFPSRRLNQKILIKGTLRSVWHHRKLVEDGVEKVTLGTGDQAGVCRGNPQRVQQWPELGRKGLPDLQMMWLDNHILTP